MNFTGLLKRMTFVDVCTARKRGKENELKKFNWSLCFGSEKLWIYIGTFNCFNYVIPFILSDHCWKEVCFRTRRKNSRDNKTWPFAHISCFYCSYFFLNSNVVLSKIHKVVSSIKFNESLISKKDSKLVLD